MCRKEGLALVLHIDALNTKQTRREGVVPLPVVVSFRTDTTRGGNPFHTGTIHPPLPLRHVEYAQTGVFYVFAVSSTLPFPSDT